jgi:hypothetical protein
VDDVGPDAQERYRFEHGTIEKDKAFAIVVVIPAVLLVKLRTVEVLRTIDQEDRDVRVGKPALMDMGSDQLGADLHLECEAGAYKLGAGRPDASMAREEKAGRVAQMRQGSGQGSGDVGKASGLGERDSFRRDANNIHLGSSST